MHMFRQHSITPIEIVEGVKKEKFMLEYTTLHTTQLNNVIERRFTVIKEGVLDMILNQKINDTAQKMMWAEAIHKYELVRNSMNNMGSTKSPFGIFYGEKPKIIGSFSDFGCITYVTKQEKLKKHIKYKMYKSIIVGYAENHTRGTYKFYNPETKRVIITRYVKWVDLKMTD